nr:MOSC domain-containing protein [Neobacillus sp. Marseille-Q6967]
MNIQIKNLALGKPKEYDWDMKKEVSAIGKSSTKKLVLRKSGIVGDDVANHEFHGGEDRTVCLYSYEHYADWEKEFNIKLKLPAFGENITAAGMLEKEVCIGDIYQAGDAIIQVTQGRVPCSTISKYNGVEQFLSRVVATGYTGYFFRVLEEGNITLDSEMKLISRHPKEVTVLFANQILFHDQKNFLAIEKILDVQELAEVWKQKFIKLLKNKA